MGHLDIGVFGILGYWDIGGAMGLLGYWDIGIFGAVQKWREKQKALQNRCISISMFVYVYMFIYLFACKHLYLHICTHMYIHICTYTYAYTYIHVHNNIHIARLLRPSTAFSRHPLPRISSPLPLQDYSRSFWRVSPLRLL